MKVIGKHIKLTDFPRAPKNGLAFGVRNSLGKSFNYARRFPSHMVALKACLVFTVQRIEEWEKEYQAEYEKQMALEETSVQAAELADLPEVQVALNVPKGIVLSEQTGPSLTQRVMGKLNLPKQ